jgi:quinol monooxygenase YgiN
MAAEELISVGLLVRLEARTGCEDAVEDLLRETLNLGHDEPEASAWFATRIGASTFGIIDAFPDEPRSEEHLLIAVAQALGDRGDELLAEPPAIERLHILEERLPALSA